MRWLLDTDVLLDVLADREPWVEHSAQVLEFVERGRATGYVAAHAVTTLHYLLATHRDRTTARRKSRLLLRLLEVVPVDEDRLLQAMDLSTPDFEGTDLAVRSPSELLARLGDRE